MAGVSLAQFSRIAVNCQRQTNHFGLSFMRTPTLIVRISRVVLAWLLIAPAAAAQTGPCNTLQTTASVNCLAGTAQLSATSGFNSYYWAPSTNLSNPGISNPVASAAGTYTVTASYVGPNMVVNPAFASGNTGFTSGMNFSATYTPCNYYVGPQWFGNYFPGLTDHTPTSDNMFMHIDGCTSQRIIWEEGPFLVQPNTDYLFYFWATEAGANQPTYEIHFIGNITGDNIISTQPGIAPPTNNSWIWDQYGVPSWNAGPNTSVTIRIINLATQGYGVDFGMDDFEFRQFCTNTDSVQVIFPSPVNLGADISTCDVSAVTLNAGPGTGYLWNTGATTQTISPAVAGPYSVTVQNGNCTFQDTIVITDIAQHVSLGQDISLCEVYNVELNAGAGVSYLWSTGETSQVIHPTSPGTYWVTVDDGNCSTRDSIELTGVFGEGALFIPNTFTPDGNRTNDEFFVYGTGIVDYRLRIFNRWGELIFESSDPAQGWNGQYNSTIVEEGVYVYVIDYTTSCNGTFNKKVGHVNVVR